MVRRVDSLGRIVIPKEIRKVLKIKENEQVEINVSNDSIILNRYSSIDKYDIALTNLIEVIETLHEEYIFFTDLSSIVLTPYKYQEYKGKYLSPYLSHLIDLRSDVCEISPRSLNLINEEEAIMASYNIKTIIKNGDTVGLLIMISNKELEDNSLERFKLMELFLDKYLE